MFNFECPNLRIRIAQLSLLVCTGLFLLACGQSTEKFIANGEEFLLKRKFHDALMQFRAASESDKDSAKAHWGLARAYENLGRFNETLDELRKTVELDPKNLDAKVRLGNYFLLVRPPLIAEAEKLQQEIAAVDPTFVEGQILKASILAAQDGTEIDVVAEINTAIAIDVRRTESYLSLARYYMGREKGAEAEAAIKKGISVNPSAAIGLIEYGRFLTYANRQVEAESQFRHAIAADPTNIEAHESMADFYVTSRQFEKAEAAYRGLVAIQENSPESRLDMAEFYSTAERQPEAIKVIESIIAEKPEYTRARYRLGQIYLEQKNSPRVNEQLEALFNINDDDLEALMLRARVKMQDSKNDAAVKDLEEILKKQPSERDALFYISQAKISLGQLDQARAFMADLERYHPSYLRVGLLKIQDAMATGDPTGALKQASELLTKAGSATPSWDNSAARLQELKMRALSARGLAYLDLGNLVNAKVDLQETLRLSPRATSGMINLAKVYIAEKNPQEAHKLYDQAMGIDGQNFDALSGIVGVSIAMGQTGQAHSKLDMSIGINAGRKDILAALHYLKATLFMAENNIVSAENELKTAIDLDAGYLPAYSSYAAILVGRNETAAAIAQYQKVVEQGPSASILTLLGILEDSRNNPAVAESHYRRALEMAPDSPIAANNLAWLITENQGNLDEALQLATASVSKYQNVAGFYDTLGWVYLKKGLYSPAAEQLRRAIALDEKAGGTAAAGYRVRLGMALASAGDKAGARRQVEASLRNLNMLSQQEVVDAKHMLATL